MTVEGINVDALEPCTHDILPPDTLVIRKECVELYRQLGAEPHEMSKDLGLYTVSLSPDTLRRLPLPHRMILVEIRARTARKKRAWMPPKSKPPQAYQPSPMKRIEIVWRIDSLDMLHRLRDNKGKIGVGISLPETIVDKLDRYARMLGLNRSALATLIITTWVLTMDKELKQEE